MRLLIKAFLIAALCFGGYGYYKTGEFLPEIQAFVKGERIQESSQNTYIENQTSSQEQQQKQALMNKDAQYMQTYLNRVGANITSARPGTYAFSVPSGQRVEYTIKKQNPFYCPKVKKTIHRNISLSVTKPPTY